MYVNVDLHYVVSIKVSEDVVAGTVPVAHSHNTGTVQVQAQAVYSQNTLSSVPCDSPGHRCQVDIVRTYARRPTPDGRAQRGCAAFTLYSRPCPTVRPHACPPSPQSAQPESAAHAPPSRAHAGVWPRPPSQPTPLQIHLLAGQAAGGCVRPPAPEPRRPRVWRLAPNWRPHALWRRHASTQPWPLCRCY